MNLLNFQRFRNVTKKHWTSRTRKPGGRYYLVKAVKDPDESMLKLPEPEAPEKPKREIKKLTKATKVETEEKSQNQRNRSP